MFTISKVPYADLYYGEEAVTSHTSLAEYISQFHKGGDHPSYIFDGTTLHKDSQLSQDVPIPELFSDFIILLKQFTIGPRDSGSPPHFHRHVFNGLVYGLKHWYLWPPSTAHFAYSHVKDWQREYLEGKYSSFPAIECVQRPGEVVYVPENWGHAVVNLEDSIAVAFEFT